MKISKLLFALVILLSAACNTKTSGDEHGTEDGAHSHDDEGNHEEQEEFTADGDSTNETASSINTTDQKNIVRITIPAKKGLEYKFYLKQYEKLTYDWVSEIPLYFDFHGEPLDYETTKYFESFTAGTSDKMKGIMTAPFEGSHGWYWKNESEKDVSVTLKTSGNYRVIGLK